MRVFIIGENDPLLFELGYNVDSGYYDRDRIAEWRRDGGFYKNIENLQIPTFIPFHCIKKITFEDIEKEYN